MVETFGLTLRNKNLKIGTLVYSEALSHELAATAIAKKENIIYCRILSIIVQMYFGQL